MSFTLVRYVLTAAIRDRLVLALMIMMVVGVSLSIFMGSAAVTEKGSFAIVFAGAGMRMAGVFGLVLFAVFFIRRSFEARDVEFLLSRPVSRFEFLLSYSAGFSILAFLLSVAQGFCIYILGTHLYDMGKLMWAVSLAVENIIMINVALFFAMILSSAATAAMATAGFYILTRMMGQLLGVIDTHAQYTYAMQILEWLMQAISAVLPRLDLVAQTSWLIYGVPTGANIGFIFLQATVFTVLVLSCALVDLVRRQF